MLRSKHANASARHCQADGHLLSSHDYSDKYGGSTTLLRCASAVIGDHKCSVLDEQNVIPLEDLCPYHQQHVHFVAAQPLSSGADIDSPVAEDRVAADNYRISAELELPGRSLGGGEGLQTYDSLASYVSGGFSAETTTRNNRTSQRSQRSFVTFKQPTTADIARTAPASTCVSLDLIKTLRSTSKAQVGLVDRVEDRHQGPDNVATGCVSLTKPSTEARDAVWWVMLLKVCCRYLCKVLVKSSTATWQKSCYRRCDDATFVGHRSADKLLVVRFKTQTCSVKVVRID